MDERVVDAMARAARAYLEHYDRNKDGELGFANPMPGLCSGCGNLFTRDMLLRNEGAGYLCPSCGDKELSALRRKLRKMERQHIRENSIASSCG